MDRAETILFGVDGSESARQAGATAGALLKYRKNTNITIFYGAPDPQLSSLAKVFRRSPKVVEEYRKVCSLQEHKILEEAHEALIDSGFNADKVTIRGEGKCHNPAETMLQLAAADASETIGLGKSSTGRLERMLMGSVSCRLVHCADEKTIWVIDSPIASHDVLVALGGGAISRRVMKHAVRYFAHLKESKFTFFHVAPPLPPHYWDNTRILSKQERKRRQEEIACWMREYANRVREIVDEGKENLLKAGNREVNVTFKVQTVESGTTRDILAELAEGNYGILVMGRRDSRKKGTFRLSSKANRLLHTVHDTMLCLVN
jgi:nucleotide-binding universal stress UspA family protein